MEAARLFGVDARLGAGDAARLAIVVEELVANLVEHGGAAAIGAIELSLAWEAGGPISLVLVDGGIAFDPRGADAGAAIPERGGGAGLNLVRAWATIVEYRSDGDRNRTEVSIPVG
ncbi:MULTISPECIES: ATP-binding protein [unclassified Sphingomonas]|uniref:ATP-binding protein n=1 Tax=unclassified Sphingomonas TaxID=196159 RepID=UPI001F3509B8|nr:MULTISPECIES: ATP-binding protein [unclassified Sphingomonas]